MWGDTTRTTGFSVNLSKLRGSLPASTGTAEPGPVSAVTRPTAKMEAAANPIHVRMGTSLDSEHGSMNDAGRRDSRPARASGQDDHIFSGKHLQTFL